MHTDYIKKSEEVFYIQSVSSSVRLPRQSKYPIGVNIDNLIKIPLQEAPRLKPPLTSKQLRFAVLNVRSLKTKTFIINDLIADNILDFIFLTETWLSTDGAISLIEASPPNYNFFQIIRQRKRVVD